MLSTPDITMITAVKNAAQTIEKTIHSVLNQTGVTIEYLIVDGGSTDGTLEIIARYQDRIKLVSFKEENGPMDAYARAMALAQGDIVGMVSADDWIMPDTFSAVMSVFKQRPDIDVVSCHSVLVQSEPRVKECYREVRYFGDKYNTLDLFSILVWPLINERFFRRSILSLDQIRFADDTGLRIISADTEFMVRLVLQGAKNYALPKLAYVMLKHENSLTNTSSVGRKFEIYAELVRLSERLLQERISLQHYRAVLKFHQYCLSYQVTRGWLLDRTIAKQAWKTAYKIYGSRFIITLLRNMLHNTLDYGKRRWCKLPKRYNYSNEIIEPAQ